MRETKPAIKYVPIDIIKKKIIIFSHEENISVTFITPQNCLNKTHSDTRDKWRRPCSGKTIKSSASSHQQHKNSH